MESSREARRRRIMERGTDRLALITGQTRLLPSDPDQSLGGGHSHTASCPPSISQVQLPPPFSSPPSQSLDSSQTEDKASGSFSSLHANLESVRETNPQFVSGDRVGPIMRKCESSMESSKVSATFGLDGKRPSDQVQNPRVSTSQKDQQFEAVSRYLKICTPNEIHSAIAATERTRTLCSLVVGILVVLAYVRFPILGSRFVKSVIFFRPLYLLLLTNVTIVVARLLEKQRGLWRPGQQATNVPSVGENGLANQLGNAVELWLLLQNVTGSLFMDCSIYSITVICSLSLVQRLGGMQ